MVTVIALLVALVTTGVAAVIAQMARGQQRAHERELTRLIDQVCHLAGKPWALPPRELQIPVDIERSEDDLAGLIEV